MIKTRYFDDTNNGGEILNNTQRSVLYGRPVIFQISSKQNIKIKTERMPFLKIWLKNARHSVCFLKCSRRFTKSEKDRLLLMHKHRSSVMKDHRFSVSYAAYVLGDRSTCDITHIWTYLDPDVNKCPFTPDEDSILLRQANQNSSISWSMLAATYLPNRSAVHCRRRYLNLIKSQSAGNTKRTSRNVCLINNHFIVLKRNAHCPDNRQ